MFKWLEKRRRRKWWDLYGWPVIQALRHGQMDAMEIAISVTESTGAFWSSRESYDVAIKLADEGFVSVEMVRTFGGPVLAHFDLTEAGRSL